MCSCGTFTIVVSSIISLLTRNHTGNQICGQSFERIRLRACNYFDMFSVHSVVWISIEFGFLFGMIVVFVSTLIYGGMIKLPGDWWSEEPKIFSSLRLVCGRTKGSVNR